MYVWCRFCACVGAVRMESKEGGGSPGAGVAVVSCFVWVLSTELGSSLRTLHSLNL